MKSELVNTLKVKINNEESGKLHKEKDKFIFSYNNEKSEFISLTMPVRIEQYVNNKLHPIFEMHLPEGYLLSVIKKHFSKLVKLDGFGLLKLMTNSISGRITYDDSNKKNTNSLSLEDLLNPKTDNLFEELVSRFALNSTISGVQPKVLASIENKATLLYDDYIIKSWGNEYPNLALNEFYCMNIAKYALIKVPEFYLSNDDKLFIMKRFDIKKDGTKIGFEDICVLQAKQVDDKYEGTYEKITKTIKIFVSNKYKKDSLIQFFKMIVINNIIQNGDAHLKNFGLIYDDMNNVKLAPAYDIVSTTAYIKNDIPALYLLGSKKWMSKKYIIMFGINYCNLSNSEANLSYNECISATKKVALEIHQRVIIERDESKLMVLEHLLKLLSDKRV